MIAIKTSRAQCGDCEFNGGDNGDGCRCSLHNKPITPIDDACRDFILWADLEEYDALLKGDKYYVYKRTL